MATAGRPGDSSPRSFAALDGPETPRPGHDDQPLPPLPQPSRLRRKVLGKVHPLVPVLAPPPRLHEPPAAIQRHVLPHHEVGVQDQPRPALRPRPRPTQRLEFSIISYSEQPVREVYFASNPKPERRNPKGEREYSRKVAGSLLKRGW